MKLFKKTPWIIGVAVAAPLLVISSVGYYLVAGQFSSQINAHFGWRTSKTVSGGSDEDSEYFKKHYATVDDQVAHEQELCEKLEEEGASLLRNNNNALPLAGGANVSCFSQSSVNLIYGGTGSGAVNSATAPSLSVALKNKGFNNNPTLRKFYSASGYKRQNAETTGGNIAQYAVNEVPWAEYTDEVKNSFKDYGDAAIVVIARSGGEGADLPNKEYTIEAKGKVYHTTDYLVLTQEEKDMLQNIKQYKADGVFKKIIVLLNGSNTMQLDWFDTYDVDAAMWIGDPGQTGINGVVNLLAGTANPSGRIVDTFLKDNASSPAYSMLGDFFFTNKEEYGLDNVQANVGGEAINNCNSQYMVYQEGIYVGYRYYETRYADSVMNKGNSGTWNYASSVAYPFGTGLSYTKFDYSEFKLTPSDDKFELSVKVTNSGSVAGKHTVQAYFQSPYTSYDKENHIEKAAIELCGFQKTELLAPGASEVVTIDVDKDELRTYDANLAKTYILDGGDYYFTIGRDAHDAINNVLAARNYTTSDGMDAPGDKTLTQKWTTTNSEANPDKEIFSKSKYTEFPITNQFDHADPNKYEGTPGHVTYLSREDWTATFPTSAPVWAVNEKMWKDGLTDIEADRQANIDKMIAEHYSDAKMPTYGANGDLSAIKMKGKDFNDEKWEDLLNQLDFGEAINTIYNGFHKTAQIISIGLPDTKDENGPQGYTASLVGGENAVNGMAYTSEDVMAATFNLDLIKDMGESIGEDCLVAGNAGLYGPGCNTHRSQYDGRNFEYYSEDGFVAKKCVGVEVAAIESRGVYVLTKHFALNETEQGRYGLSTWSNEQAIREIYLEPFEGTVTNSMGGVMSSFNRFGVIWAGADYNLMTNVLRNEWGGQGMAITDCGVFAGYMDCRLGTLAGQNLWDGSNGKGLDSFKNNPAGATAIRNSIHRIAYSICNSLAMNGTAGADRIVRAYTPLEKGLIAGIAVTATATVACGAMLVLSILKSKKKAD
ncbi:MAG: glycoside hydrolase family 3 C-terminal domain-containing protein [Bacilli bacterium]|nr:glycoside hydrolase family 3 C-terminal domain-containing protein [Bacilli bacterium]